MGVAREVYSINSVEYPNEAWIVYETDERGAYHVISKHSSEEEGLEALLLELRNKKKKEAIMKKLRK